MEKKLPRSLRLNFSNPEISFPVITAIRLSRLQLGLSTMEEFFAQLYADPDPANDTHSAGRQMNSHFATEMVNGEGEWLDLANRKNIAAGMAPTAAQMPRSLGLALASKLFRNEPSFNQFSNLQHER